MENQEAEQSVVDILEEPVVAEKMLSQSEVNKVVGRAKAEAEQRTRRQLEEEYKKQLAELAAKQYDSNKKESREINADAMYQQIQERFNIEMQQKQLEQQLSNVANQYMAKVEAAKTGYDDFDEVTKDFDPTAFPQLIFLLSGIEGAGDVVYELAKNPLKLAALDRMAEKTPKLAHNELLKLAASINVNKSAKSEGQYDNAPAPLDRLTSSRNTGSNGKPSIRDLRSQDWLRG